MPSRPAPAGPDRREREKKAAAESAAQLVGDGMMVGLGTGTTVGYLLPALAARRLDVRCVSTSPATEAAARALGLKVLEFIAIERLDIAIDGADQVAPDRWLIKGGGGAHTREKIVAGASERFVVIVSSDKLVERLASPVPLELMTFGLGATLEALRARGSVRPRPSTPPSPDGGVIADWFSASATIDDPAKLASWLAGVPGVVEHGLFSPDIVSDVIVG